MGSLIILNVYKRRVSTQEAFSLLLRFWGKLCRSQIGVSVPYSQAVHARQPAYRLQFHHQEKPSSVRDRSLYQWVPQGYALEKSAAVGSVIRLK